MRIILSSNYKYILIIYVKYFECVSKIKIKINYVDWCGGADH